MGNKYHPILTKISKIIELSDRKDSIYFGFIFVVFGLGFWVFHSSMVTFLGLMMFIDYLCITIGKNIGRKINIKNSIHLSTLDKNDTKAADITDPIILNKNEAKAHDHQGDGCLHRTKGRTIQKKYISVCTINEAMDIVGTKNRWSIEFPCSTGEIKKICKKGNIFLLDKQSVIDYAKKIKIIKECSNTNFIKSEFDEIPEVLK